MLIIFQILIPIIQGELDWEYTFGEYKEYWLLSIEKSNDGGYVISGAADEISMN